MSLCTQEISLLSLQHPCLWWCGYKAHNNSSDISKPQNVHFIPRIASISRTIFFAHSQEGTSHLLNFYQEIVAILVTSPFLILILLSFLPHLQLLPPLKSWTSQSHPWVWKPVSSKLLLMLISSSHEYSWIFLMVSRMVNPFQEDFNLLCPDPPTTYYNYSFLKNRVLK